MRKRILCYGDSNTWGYMPGIGTRYEEDVHYPGVLAADLGQAYRVVEEAAGEGQAHPGHQGAGAVILLVSPVPIHPENDPMFDRESWKRAGNWNLSTGSWRKITAACTWTQAPSPGIWGRMESI